MHRFAKVLMLLPIFCLSGIVLSCNTHGSNPTVAVKAAATAIRLTKPPSSHQDTLIVRGNAAVFYYPDSLQLNKYKAAIDSNAYKSIDHEFF